MKQQQGFTLTEMLVAIGVMALLMAAALPAYQNHVLKAHRVDAKNALLDLSGREERYFSTHAGYTQTPTDLGYSAWPAMVPASGQAAYAISVTATATSFSLSAVPQAAQSGDGCGTFTLDQFGVKGNSGNTNTSGECWR